MWFQYFTMCGKQVYCFPCCASFLVASCSNAVSISSAGSCTYLITEPLMKQFFTDNCGQILKQL